MKDIVDNDIFAMVLAYMYHIKFQKRGLPHAHLPVKLKTGFSPNCATNCIGRNSRQEPEWSGDVTHDARTVRIVERRFAMHDGRKVF